MKLTLPPGPRGLAAFAALRRARRHTIETFARWRDEYGDAVLASAGGRGLMLISHPELVSELLVVRHREFHKSRTLRRASVLLGNGLLTSEDDVHLRQRRLVQPAFHRDRVARYAETMIALAAETSDSWRAGQVVDAHAAMMRLTLRIAGLTLFSADVDDEADSIGGALTDAMNVFDRLKSPWWPVLSRLPLPATFRMRAARERLDATVRRIVRERRAHPSHPDDLLSMLLAARDTESASPDGLDDQQVCDEVLTLFLAGHETTSNALTWSWLLLAEHPEVADRLRGELRDVLGGRTPTPADVGALPFTRAVFAEAMRLYPPAWIVGRQATKSTTLGPWDVPAGTMVFASQWLMHRDPRFFQEPLRFDPERWLGNVSDSARRAYFPFGAGVRKCVGEAFAWTEGTLVLASIAQRWRMVRVDSVEIPVLPQITLRPARAVWLRLEAA